jgi:hypothetical protein
MEVLPEYLKDDWADVLKKLDSFRRYLKTSQVSRFENCFYDLVPDRFLLDYCGVKNRITSYVLKNIRRPRRYEFYWHVGQLLYSIESRKINFDRRLAASHLDPKAKEMCKKPPFIRYTQFGTKTGRLTTHRESFPILTLKKDLRSLLRPVNDFFVEIDFNGCEIRTLLGILGKEQPREDVHDFHLRRVFGKSVTRPEAKRLFFAWLYGAKKGIDDRVRSQLEGFYDTSTILDNCWEGTKLTTPYGKIICDVDEHHALNYLIQSTAAELSLKQFLKVHCLLQRKSATSFISMLLHDSLILDFRKGEEHLLSELCYLMGSTNFGTFRLNVSQGVSLGNMTPMDY